MKPMTKFLTLAAAAACMIVPVAGRSSIALDTLFAQHAPGTDEKREKETGTWSSSLEDRTGVALTIYNVNLGLVKDQRRIRLPKGVADLRFMDVAAKIIPASVHIRSVVSPETLRVLEQNYEYDLLNPQKLLDKYVGREVKLFTKNP